MNDFGGISTKDMLKLLMERVSTNDKFNAKWLDLGKHSIDDDKRSTKFGEKKQKIPKKLKWKIKIEVKPQSSITNNQI